jgi:hypothetical protein
VIVRILGEGQLHVEDSLAAELNALDADLEAACERNDEEAFETAMTGLLSLVRKAGSPVPADSLEASDVILPHEGATMAEVRKLLTDDGLIPG